MTPSTRFALIALLLALPMAVLLGSIVFEIQLVETAFKAVFTTDGDRPNIFGFIFMGTALLALPIALVISLWPMIRSGTNGKRHFLLANALVAVLVVTLMTPTWGGLAKDIYRCDILGIPNCD